MASPDLAAYDDKEWKGASFKEDVDYSKEVDEALGKINATTAPVLLRSSPEGAAALRETTTTSSSVGSSTGSGSGPQAKLAEVLRGLLEPLFTLEKMARLGSDVLSAKRVAVEILKVYRTLHLHDAMLAVMLDLMRKRAQSKQVQTAMVEECAVVLTDGSLSSSGDEEVEAEEAVEAVLERLAYATENKIHVELQHARFTAQLAVLQEKKGLKLKASQMLSTLQVETITTMPRVEKLHLLNMQIRLCLELDQLELIPSISRKISFRALAREEASEEKLHYFTLMRQFYTIKKSYFHVGRCWLETFVSLEASKAADQKIHALRSAVLFYLIADYSTEKQLEDAGECTAFSPDTRFPDRSTALVGLCERWRSDLEDIPALHSLVQRFNSIVLVREKITQDVERLCGTYEELSAFPDRQELLRNRCSEHDLVVVSTFYNRVPLQRLAELVGLSEAHTEKFLMQLVGDRTLYAKMDRVDGLVEFEAKRNTAEVVEFWSDAVERCVALLDEASHLITKERMLANVQQQNQNRVIRS